MKKTKEEDEGYYGISGLVAVVLVLLIHYFFLSNLEIHPTIHVVIGLFIFFLISSTLSSLLSKIWNKF